MAFFLGVFINCFKGGFQCRPDTTAPGHVLHIEDKQTAVVAGLALGPHRRTSSGFLVYRVNTHEDCAILLTDQALGVRLVAWEALHFAPGGIKLYARKTEVSRVGR